MIAVVCGVIAFGMALALHVDRLGGLRGGGRWDVFGRSVDPPPIALIIRPALARRTLRDWNVFGGYGRSGLRVARSRAVGRPHRQRVVTRLLRSVGEA